MTALLDRYHRLRDDIPASVELVAVAKNHPASAVEALLAAGQRSFGENRVQEAAEKYPALRLRYPDLRLHLIGPLQTNKVKQAVALFDVIETIDRPKLAQSLAAEMARGGRFLPGLIEVNIGAEPQKAGIAPEQTADFLAACRGWGLTIDGLMCIPPQSGDSERYFRDLAALAASLKLAVLSMGMSSDYRQAILCGATHVRVGTKLFGARA